MARKGFKGCNVFCQGMKATRGRKCNRKAVLRAIKKGMAPAAAANAHCGSKRK